MAGIEEIAAFMKAEFPQFRCTIESVGNKGATVIRKIGIDELRPGGITSRLTPLRFTTLRLAETRRLTQC